MSLFLKSFLQMLHSNRDSRFSWITLVWFFKVSGCLNLIPQSLHWSLGSSCFHPCFKSALLSLNKSRHWLHRSLTPLCLMASWRFKFPIWEKILPQKEQGLYFFSILLLPEWGFKWASLAFTESRLTLKDFAFSCGIVVIFSFASFDSILSRFFFSCINSSSLSSMEPGSLSE